jgi:hypothetical protein
MQHDTVLPHPQHVVRNLQQQQHSPNICSSDHHNILQLQLQIQPPVQPIRKLSISQSPSQQVFDNTNTNTNTKNQYHHHHHHQHPHRPPVQPIRQLSINRF